MMQVYIIAALWFSLLSVYLLKLAILLAYIICNEMLVKIAIFHTPLFSDSRWISRKPFSVRKLEP